ncbi:MAG: YitT family protein [Pseudomonadota bacterium]
MTDTTTPEADGTKPSPVPGDDDGITLAQRSKHSLLEDIFAISVGVVLVTFGVLLFQQAQLVMGGVAGIALVTSYATGFDFGVLFFVINLPFYVFGVGGLGWRFIIKTFCAVALMSVLVRLVPSYFVVQDIHPMVAAIAGGSMIGLGLLALFRHGAGLGGINIFVYWLQSTRNIRAGYAQLAVDACILVAAVFVVGPVSAAWSVLGAVLFNMILGVNHRPGRYMGAS